MQCSRAALLLACAAVAGPAAAEFSPDLASLPSVPRAAVPAGLLEKALDEPIKGSPYQFAVPVPLVIAPEQGLWEAQGGQLRWRLRLHSPGARSLSLHFTQPVLPAGSTLWIYDPAARLKHGPYGAARIGADGLWTPAVGGEELVVEIRAPAASANAVRLGKVQAFHGFRTWEAEVSPKVGSCNIDITCSGDPEDWVEDGSAVARISIGGAYLCTGQLLNNVRQDQRRLFITANHCGVNGDSGPASSVMFFFGYEGDCDANQSDAVLPAPSFQGSELLARDVQSDFALLEITDTAALPAGVRFAGWDATGAGASSGAAIHHPDGDEKKIAFHTTPATQDTINVGTGCAVDAWRVQWSSGTTEPGSSGGALWNSAHRIIGVLSGGAASCLTPTGFDYFARLDRAWTASAAASGQLKAHLDPDNTCVAIVPLLDPATTPGPVAPTPQNQSCSGPASTCGVQLPRRGGGGAPGWLTLAVLGLAALRRRSDPDDQQHARDRHH